MDGPGPAAPYPAHWEADVVLSDGATAHLRPIRPDDADRLVEFYGRVSDESKYFRFFAPYPTLSARDVEKFTQVDHVDRVALIMLIGDDMIAVSPYERLDTHQAEVAFLVEDAHQSRGIGSIMLEHLAQAARERGIGKFVAETLAQNDKMITVFGEAGYTMASRLADGVIHVAFEIGPTDHSIQVMTAREHRAEARSIQRLLTPRSVAVIGASRSRDKVGHALVRNLVRGGFTGPVYAVNPDATAVSGVPAYPNVRDVPGEVDLAVVAVPAEAVTDVVLDCAAKGVKGLVVLSAGFAETG
ncbi:MAG: GNAT family N-acetyltransferase, partial [Jiangellaceae bacterium]